MDNNHTDDYVLVLEDRTEVKNEAEVGKLSGLMVKCTPIIGSSEI